MNFFNLFARTLETILYNTLHRLISDNILVAFETLHCMKNCNSGKTRFMAIKLDMSKAYDGVEWIYL